MAQCSQMYKDRGDTEWFYCVLDAGHAKQHEDIRGRKFFNPPNAHFCRHPDKCVNGRCESEIACND